MTIAGEASDFTVAGYRALVEAFLDRGYRVHGFADAEPATPHLVLRHDIDVALAPAVEIAEVEADLGVAAFYFVMLRNPLYNPFAPDEHAALARLGALGHEIGLHLDAALYGEDADALGDGAARECGILEEIVGEPVRVLSLHRPARSLLGRETGIAGRVHTYQPRFFSDMGYCSDSRGAWHHGHPLDHPAVRDRRAVQLLTHPVWWVGRTGSSMTERLDALLDERAGSLRRSLAAIVAGTVVGAREEQ